MQAIIAAYAAAQPPSTFIRLREVEEAIWPHICPTEQPERAKRMRQLLDQCSLLKRKGRGWIVYGADKC